MKFLRLLMIFFSVSPFETAYTQEGFSNLQAATELVPVRNRELGMPDINPLGLPMQEPPEVREHRIGRPRALFMRRRPAALVAPPVAPAVPVYGPSTFEEILTPTQREIWMTNNNMRPGTDRRHHADLYLWRWAPIYERRHIGRLYYEINPYQRDSASFAQDATEFWRRIYLIHRTEGAFILEDHEREELVERANLWMANAPEERLLFQMGDLNRYAFLNHAHRLAIDNPNFRHQEIPITVWQHARLQEAVQRIDAFIPTIPVPPEQRFQRVPAIVWQLEVRGVLVKFMTNFWNNQEWHFLDSDVEMILLQTRMNLGLPISRL